MRKTHTSSTVSSQQKTMPPVNIRERVVRLTETVNELKTNIEVEERHKDTIEKVNAQNYNVLNSQIKALKKAFNTLADVVMEEIDSFKSDIFKDFQDSNESVYRRIDEFSAQLYKVQSERQDHKTYLISLDQDLRERCRNLEKRHEEDFQALQALIEAGRDDNKVLFEKLKIVTNNNTSQLDLLSKDNEKLHGELNNLVSRLSTEATNIKIFQKKMADIEERILKSNDQVNAVRQSNKSEMQAILKAQTEVNKRLEETTGKLFDKVESNKTYYEHKFTDIERSLSRLQMEFQENIEELAKIHKDSSTQLILDFEKAITSLSNDTKVIFKKFGNVEENLIKIRDEFGTMVNENHHVMSRKTDNFEKAFYEICRKLNIQNPLLAY